MLRMVRYFPRVAGHVVGLMIIISAQPAKASMRRIRGATWQINPTPDRNKLGVRPVTLGHATISVLGALPVLRFSR